MISIFRLLVLGNFIAYFDFLVHSSFPFAENLSYTILASILGGLERFEWHRQSCIETVLLIYDQVKNEMKRNDGTRTMAGDDLARVGRT